MRLAQWSPQKNSWGLAHPALGALCFGFFCLSGGQPEAAPSTPELAVETCIERMGRVQGDPKLAREAYDLLWSGAKAELVERAQRASNVVGHKVEPEEMIVPSRFSLRFRPKGFSAKIQGKWARVTVTGETPQSELKEVYCVLEDDHWRVALQLPALERIRARPSEAE